MKERNMKESSRRSKKIIKEMIEKGKEGHRLIIESMADVIVVLNMSLRFVYVSPSIFRLRGYTPEEAMAQTVEEVVTSASLAILRVAIEEELELEISGTADPKRTRVFEIEEYHKNGSTIWVEARLSFARDQDGVAIGFIAVSHDITELRRSEKALQKKTALLEALTKTTPDGMLVINDKNIRVFINPQFIRMLCVPEDVLIDPEDTALLNYVSSRTVYPEQFLKKIRYLNEYPDETSRDEIEFDINGERRFLDRYSAPVLGEGGEYYGRVWIFRDITQHKKLEETQLVFQKLQSLGVMAGGIAHDFNNLLTVIMGYVSMFLSRDDPEKQKTLVEKTIEAVKKAANLTIMFLAFAEGGIQEKRAGAISEVVLEASNLAIGKGSSSCCRMFLPDDLWLAEMDSASIVRVFQNLLINARQAMPEGGIIRIEGKNVVLPPENVFGLEGGMFVQVSVNDQGIGIPPENLDKIFDPYFTTKDKSGGSGLGLSVAYKIIGEHKGAITVQSEPGKGTTFGIFLPAFEREVLSEEADNQKPKNSGSLNILVMDDEDGVKGVLEEMIKSLGHQAKLVNNGLEAMAEYSLALELENPFDLVILDLIIPGGMGGVETLRKLKEIDQSVVAVISSGYSSSNPEGFYDILPKPYALENLANLLKKFCNR